jgi:redox-sensing transcriptional repressor
VPNAEGLVVQPLTRLGEVVRTEQAQIGIITVPAEQAQSVAKVLLEAGVRGILNFAPVALDLPIAVPVVSVDLAVHLEQLSFQVCELGD